MTSAGSNKRDMHYYHCSMLYNELEVIFVCASLKQSQQSACSMVGVS